MAKGKTKQTSFNIQEMDLAEAQREFNRRRGRGSKYDDVIAKAEKLGKGKALIVGGLSYSEVTGLRKRIADYLGNDWSVSSTRADKEKGLYDALIHHKK